MKAHHHQRTNYCNYYTNLILCCCLTSTFLLNPLVTKFVQCKQENLESPKEPPAQATSSSSSGGGGSSRGKQQNERLNLNEADEHGLYLVGLFDVHHSNPRVPFKCGQIDVDAGEWQSRRPMQNMEAFLWAIEQVNSDKSLLPGVHLGSLVMDTCSSFLRTNQQMANLLHGQLSARGQQVPSPRQIMAIVADNSDWHSVEAVASMASALGLTTFVTQSRSSKLGDLARRYRSGNEGEIGAAAAAASGQLNQAASGSLVEPISPPVASSQPFSLDYSQELQRRSLAGASAYVIGARPPAQGASSDAQFEGLLGELLGIGRMMSSPLERGPLEMSPGAAMDSAAAALESPMAPTNDQQQQQQKLYMVRMLLGNELIAEAIGSLVQQMNWDLVSLVYDDELDMVDLHDELAKQLFARNVQLALDEQVSLGSPTEVYDRLLQNLAKKSTSGGRVVITLLGTGSARVLLDSLHHLRNSASSSEEQVRQVNSLLWITVSDREPYYSFATDALGSVAISSSVSLMPEFRAYYDRLASEEHASANKWWPEYLRAILVKSQKEVELVSNECAKWLEPKVSPLNERCRALSLSSLAQLAERTGRNGSVNNSSLWPTAYGNNGKMYNSKSKQQGNGNKLAKYLAGGWEHNGMDVINAVLSVANGLESIRQALCPEQASGICAQMRELVSGGNGGNSEDRGGNWKSGASPSSNSNGPFDLPMLSELIYNELLRSTFQLADGRMFNLDDFTASSQANRNGVVPSQVEGKLKFYNLRYLRANSIGFVKFAHFDQQDGLSMNSSMALHYPNNNYLDQVPIERVKSSCQDESKCLMLASYEQAMNKQAAGGISEDELALGVNTLFKLDHPLILSPGPTSSSSSAPRGGDEFGQRASGKPAVNGSPNSAAGAGQRVSEQQQQELEDSHMHTMRSQPGMSGHHFMKQQQQQLNWSTTDAESAKQQAPVRLTYNTIVLLPLHKGYQSSASGPSSAQQLCSDRMDIEHSFQHLAALAFAQSLANGIDGIDGNHRHHWSPALQSSTSSLSTSQAQPTSAPSAGAVAGGETRAQIELTTTVIDYCEHVTLAKQKLAAKLSEMAPPTPSAAGLATGEAKSRLQLAAVIDFDARLSESVAQMVGEKNLLHLTISPPSAQLQLLPASQRTDAAGHDHFSPTTDDHRQLAGRQHRNHLRMSLLPSKLEEIQALVKLISSMGQWKLVHLIYTDHHHYRDEFVRRANEANICVSKLIWIPSAELEVGDEDESSNKESATRPTNERLRRQAEKMRKLFANELHDYSAAQNLATHSGGATMKGADEEPPLTAPPPSQEQQHPGQSSVAAAAKPTSSGNATEGLNTTRVLVLLASSNEATNRLILESASKSMLDDYIWLVSHEWLSSVELPHEQQQQREPEIITPPLAASTGQGGRVRAGAGSLSRLPRFLLATRLETSSTRPFRHYLASLSPAVHAPLPTDWFDQFWQQNFHCRLPISGSQTSSGVAPVAPICKSNEHLDLHRLAEDDRVHYTIAAVQSLHVALSALYGSKSAIGKSRKNNNNEELLLPTTETKADELASEFRRAFHQAQRGHSTPDGATGAANSLTHLPYGFHIVHRLLPLTMYEEPQRAQGNKSSRRQNSRDLSQWTPGQLIKVGQWRDGELILAKRPTNETRAHLLWLNPGSTETADEELASQVAMSLAKLGAIRSRCGAPRTCQLCQRQVSQTMALLRQEEARERLQSASDEPKAISSIWTLLSPGRANSKQASILDSITPGSLFDEEEERESTETEPAQSESAKMTSRSPQVGQRQQLDDIQASASSLFNAATQRQVEDQRLADTRAAYAQRFKQEQVHRAHGGWPAYGGSPSMTLNMRQGSGFLTSGLSLAGIVSVIISMAYLYPSMLGGENGGKFEKSPLSSYFISNGQQQPQQGQPIKKSRSGLDNITDYFLLTGLLMLYSINMAFLLPATLNVCWLRRIGLATSYTVLFSSILVKVLANFYKAGSPNGPQRSLRRRQKDQICPMADTTGAISSRPGATSAGGQQAVVDPVEEGVEVTFESLPPEQGGHVAENQQQQQSCTTIDHLSNAYQTHSPSSSANNNVNITHGQQHNNNSCTLNNEPQTSNGTSMATLISFHLGASNNLLTLLICLILAQVIWSLIWLGQRPPEPTLYLSCWHCSSPARSPVLYLYEPLLSLLYPLLVLISAWIYSLFALKTASEEENRKRSLAARRLLSGSVTSNSGVAVPGTSQAKIAANQVDQLEHKVRETKSLVMTTTLLILIWSIVTLHLISASNEKLPHGATGPSSLITATSATGGGPNGGTPQKVTPTKGDDPTLVYANLLSGLIIFATLFIYRLHLFKRASFSSCLNWASKTGRYRRGANKSRSLIQSSHTGPNNVLKFNQSGEASEWLTRPSGDRTTTRADDRHHFVNSNNNRQERLRLQQFNSYGTYSAASNVAGPLDEYHHTNTTVNPLSLQAIASTFSSSSAAKRKAARRQEQQAVYEEINGHAALADSQQELQALGDKHNGGKAAGGGGGKRRNKASAGLFFRSSSSARSSSSLAEIASKWAAKGKSGQSNGGAAAEPKLQRRQSAGSVASSTARLMSDSGSMMMMDSDDLDDTISCASSVASSSTSQLHGNDLYPIDCSMQLDFQPPSGPSLGGPSGKTDNVPQMVVNNGAPGINLPGQVNNNIINKTTSFSRRSSARRSVNKLSSVKEEQVIERQQQTNKIDAYDETTKETPNNKDNNEI